MADEPLPSRVAVLERIAADTATALADIRTDLRALPSIREDIAALRGELHTEIATLTGRLNLIFYRLLLSLGTGIVAIGALVISVLRAHG